MMEAVRTSETSVYSNETTRHYITEGSNLHTRRRENLKSHESFVVYLTTLSVEQTICTASNGGIRES
jgi:hypothetical protein